MWIFGRFYPIEKWNSLCSNLEYWKQTKTKCLQRNNIERSLNFIYVTVLCVCNMWFRFSIIFFIFIFHRIFQFWNESVAPCMRESHLNSKFDTIDLSFSIIAFNTSRRFVSTKLKERHFFLLHLVPNFHYRFRTTSWEHSTK